METIINDAIAHLNGYALMVQNRTGFKPVAVFDTIKELNELKGELKQNGHTNKRI